MFCRTTHVFCNQLINYLLTGYPVRTENTEPSVTSHGPHFVRSVLYTTTLRQNFEDSYRSEAMSQEKFENTVSGLAKNIPRGTLAG